MYESMLLKFRKQFKESAELLSIASGRAELIGNHTDYNEGFVIGTIMPYTTKVVARENNSQTIQVYSENYNAYAKIDLENLPVDPQNHWTDYIIGLIWEFKKMGIEPKGFDAYISSDIPIGSGMSSSAAFEIVFANIISKTTNVKLSKKEIALLSYRAEHNFVKTNCGIMDQFVSALGTKNEAVFIDCRTEDYEFIMMPSEIVPIMVDTGIRRAASDALRARREEIMRALQIIKKSYNITALRDITEEQLSDLKNLLPSTLFKRVKHVVEENSRVILMTEAIKNQNYEQMKKLMIESHNSSKDLYEVSISELDKLVELAVTHKGVIGARLSGAGFGGCTINLVLKEYAADFIKNISEKYYEKTKRYATIYHGTDFQSMRIDSINKR